MLHETRSSRWFATRFVHLFKKPIHAYSLENVWECQKNKAIIVIYVKKNLFAIHFYRQNTLCLDIKHLYLPQVNQDPSLAATDYISTGVTISTGNSHAVCRLSGELRTQPHTIAVIYAWLPLAETQLLRVSD